MATMCSFPNSICEEIAEAYELYHGDSNSELALYGGTFTGIEKWKRLLMEAEGCAMNLGIEKIRISTRPDEINDVNFLVNHHVTSVELGAQSMCQDVLDNSRRGHTVEDVKKAVESLKNAGIKVSVHLMTGLPGDAKEKSLFSALKVADLKVDGVRVHPTLVLKKTELEELYSQGKYTPQSLEEALDWVSDMIAIFLNANITIERLGMYQDNRTIQNVIAGPYHPAFGELSKARLYRKFLTSTSARKVHAPSRLRSQIVGRNKDLEVEFEEDDKIWVESNGKRMSFDEWLNDHVFKIKEMAKCDLQG
jgi:histone acetyltransferase (RNA polymerase elongator complex component)